MQAVSDGARRYDARTVVLHWLTAVLVAEQWIGAQVIDWFSSGPPRVDARSVHIVFGVFLSAVLVARIGWRATGGRRLPLADRGVLNVVAKATHWALYLLLVGMVVAGVALAWARGDSLFTLFAIPSFAPGNRALAHQIQDIHAAIGWAILAVAGVHAAGALTHRFVWNDGVLGRMSLPR